MVQLWYTDKGTWPNSTLSDIGSDSDYFRKAIPQCPASGASYFLNDDNEVKGHTDGDHEPSP